MGKYVDNKRLREDLKDWKERRNVDPDAKMGDITAKAIYDIASRGINRPQFNRNDEALKEEMVSEACLEVVKYIKGFDPDKRNDKGQLTSPLSYITTMCTNAYRRVYKSWRHHNVIQKKYYIENVELSENVSDHTLDYSFYEQLADDVLEYDEELNKKKEAQRLKAACTKAKTSAKNKPAGASDSRANSYFDWIF